MWAPLASVLHFSWKVLLSNFHLKKNELNRTISSRFKVRLKCPYYPPNRESYLSKSTEHPLIPSIQCLGDLGTTSWQRRTIPSSHSSFLKVFLYFFIQIIYFLRILSKKYSEKSLTVCSKGNIRTIKVQNNADLQMRGLEGPSRFLRYPQVCSCVLIRVFVVATICLDIL